LDLSEFFWFRKCVCGDICDSAEVNIKSEEKICFESDNVFKEDWLKTYSNKKGRKTIQKCKVQSFTADNRKIKQSSYL